MHFQPANKQSLTEYEKSFFFSLKSQNKSLQINAIIFRFLSVRIMFVNTFLWNFHYKSSFQSDCFQFMQKILVSLPPANQVLNFFSHCLNALSARKWEKSKLWVSFQSNSFLFVQKLLVSLLPANQVFDFFSCYLNALSARKWEKSESQKVWVCFSVSLYLIKFSNPQSLVVAVVKLKVKNLSL